MTTTKQELNNREIMSNMQQSAALFPGQASQYVGMGRELYQSSAAVRGLYELASSLIGEDLAQISFDGPAELLKRTRFTQPAILVHSLAALTVMDRSFPRPTVAAGHSLGEYGALVAAGSLSAEDAIKLVVQRARLMEEASQAKPGTMAAIIGLTLAEVEQLCNDASSAGIVTPANINAKLQIAVSGETPAVQKTVELAKTRGARRVVMLEVGGAFHSPLMEPARLGMEQALAEVRIENPEIMFIPNVTAAPVSDGATIRELLIRQITSPVRWGKSMEYIAQMGVQSVIEIGPGKVLSGLAKREMRPERLISLDTLEDIESFLDPAPVL